MPTYGQASRFQVRGRLFSVFVIYGNCSFWVYVYFVSAKGEIRPHQADMMLLPSLFTLATVRSPMSLLPVWTHI